jgi:hypothetical protein
VGWAGLGWARRKRLSARVAVRGAAKAGSSRRPETAYGRIDDSPVQKRDGLDFGGDPRLPQAKKAVLVGATYSATSTTSTTTTTATATATVLLYYCTTVLLYYCTTVLLYYCTTTTTAAGGRVERGVPSSHLHHTVCYWSEFASSRSDNTAMRARIE